MKDIISKTRTVNLANNQATAAAGANKVLTEADIGTARNGLLILTCTLASSSDINNVEVYANDSATVLTSGSAGASSDLCKIVQDTVNSTAATTITTNTIGTIDTTGVYVYHVEGLRRYVNVQYDPDGTGSKINATLVAYDLAKAPYAAAQSAY